MTPRETRTSTGATWLTLAILFGASVFSAAPLAAQQTLGAITGTVKDSSGAAVPDVTVRARNAATNLEVTAHSQANGSYSIGNLPAAVYELTFTKPGFQTENHTQVSVNGDRTTTVDSILQVGQVSSTMEVTGIAVDEPGGHHQRLRRRPADDPADAARHRQLHAAGDS